MTVVLRHSDELELNRAEYTGSVTLHELTALADFQTSSPHWLGYDCLSIALPGSDFNGVQFSELDALFAKYRSLYEPMNFLIMRRSAWLCQSEAARRHVRYWTGDRDTKPLSSDVRVFESYESAADWLLLRPPELARFKSGEGFTEIFRATAPAAGLGR